MEIYATTVDVAAENVRPVRAHVPGNLARRIAFYRHHLAERSALDEDYGRANASCAAAAVLPTLDVLCDEGIARLNVGSWDETCASDGEALRRVRVIAVGDFDVERIMTDISGDSLELESLEHGPIQERLVRRTKFAEVLRECFVTVVFRLRVRESCGSVLAYRLM